MSRLKNALIVSGVIGLAASGIAFKHYASSLSNYPVSQELTRFYEIADLRRGSNIYLDTPMTPREVFSSPAETEYFFDHLPTIYERDEELRAEQDSLRVLPNVTKSLEDIANNADALILSMVGLCASIVLTAASVIPKPKKEPDKI